ncbi:MAG: vitamin K epoxide reductase family protein [Planktothrix sp. GU0601_MAG3]|nr:MAG: vitamin K epoxide reductase family protein [Planktothrix sp. GU0601_MAG3]
MGRFTPWIYRWSRPMIAAIALIGVIENIYLTSIKLLGGTAVCPTSGCEEVLNSPYSTVLGLPLTLFGFFAYATVLLLAVAPLILKPGDSKIPSPKGGNSDGVYSISRNHCNGVFQ